MPDYKLKDGRTVTVRDEDVDIFMSNHEGAVLITNKVDEPGKKLDPTANVEGSDNTDLKSEIISLEQFNLMKPAEKRKLKYSDAQRLLRERDAAITLSKQPWGEKFALDVSSPKFEDLSDDQLLKIKEKASKDLLSQKSDKDTFEITDEQIVIKAKDIFENKVLPSAYTENKTILEETFGVNIFTNFVGDLYRAGEQGVSTSELVDPAFDLLKNGGDTSDEDILNFIEKNKAVSENNAESDEMRNFNKIYKEKGEGVLGFIAAAVRNPDILPSLLVSSIATQVSSLRSEEVALAAGAGAAAGSVIPILGTIGGAIGGGAMAMESALTFGELLQETVGDDLSVDKIRAVLQDPEKLYDLRKKSIGRGIAIGTFEGLTGGIAKGIGSKLASRGLDSATRSVTAGVIEAVGGGGGEVAGRIAAGQEMDIREIGFEAITGTATAPISVGKQMLDLDNRIIDFNVNKELKNTKFNNFEQAFAPEEKTSKVQMSLVKMKNGSKILRDRVKTSIEIGSITEKQGKDIEINFRNTQSAVNTIEKTKIVSSDKAKAVDLLIEKKKRTDNIKTIDDSALTKTESDRVEVINKELEVLVKTGETIVNKDLLETNINTVRDQAKNIEGLEIKDFANAKDIDAFIKEKGLEIDKKASGNQGFIYQDSSTGEQTIIINREIASEEKAVNVAAHEFLHGALFNTLKNSPDTQTALGVSLKATIDNIDLDKVSNSDFAKRLEQYANEKENIRSEEVLTLFSDALATGDIKFNENIFTKIGDVVRRSLQKIGVEIKFNNGRDVYNFVKDYNNSISKGKLNKSQIKAAKEGVRGELVSEAKETTTESSVKEAKQLTSEQDKSIASEVIDLQAIKKENKDLAAKYGKEPIKGGKETRLENKILESIDPIIGRAVSYTHLTLPTKRIV